MLSWGDTMLEADESLHLASQSEWVRKEQLYLRIIALLDQGKVPEITQNDF
jgi:hypothetical protein